MPLPKKRFTGTAVRFINPSNYSSPAYPILTVIYRMLVDLVHVTSHQDHIERCDLQVRYLVVTHHVVDEIITLILLPFLEKLPYS